jgi:hypothetical protein
MHGFLVLYCIIPFVYIEPPLSYVSPSACLSRCSWIHETCDDDCSIWYAKRCLKTACVAQIDPFQKVWMIIAVSGVSISSSIKEKF